MLGDKKEAKFGGVMSVQNIHVIFVSLLCFSSISYINKCIIALYMIFGFFCALQVNMVVFGSFVEM